jgi:hypothetical protein
MPNGIIHEQLRKRGRLLFFPLSAIISFYLSPLPLKYFGEVLISVGIIFGYEAGRYVTPDWDIMGTTADEGRFVNDIPVLGHLLYGISSIYGSVFRRWHRSFITHFPFVSTSIRYVILFWWVFIFIYQSKYDLAWLIFIFIGMYIGMSFADGVHWWADVKTKWKYED